MTHTYAILEISKPAYDEIYAALQKAGYQHVFRRDDQRNEIILIDMHGIALAAKKEP